MLNYKDNNLITEYPGGYDTFKPQQGYDSIFTGYNIPAGQLGMSTDARTANVLQEVNTKLNMGAKTLELSQVSPEVFEAVPKGQLKEVNRLAKLTGTEVTLHAPVVEPSGLSQQGFDESIRQSTERQMKLAMDRANELNPDKSSPVTFHSTAQIPGTQWKPTEEGKEEQVIAAVNKETGKIVSLKEETKYYPDARRIKPELKEKLDSLPPQQREQEIEKLKKEGKEVTEEIPLDKGEIYKPQKQLDIINDSEWDNSLKQLFFNKERADEIIQKESDKIQHLLPSLKEGNYTYNDLLPEQKRVYDRYVSARNYLEDVHRQARSLFSKAYEYGDEKQREYLKQVSQDFRKQLEKDDNILNQSKAMTKLINNLNEITPKMYEPVEEFTTDKASETFSNVALHSYKQYKDSAPIVSIENPPYGGALSSGEDLKKLVDETRKKFIDKAVKEGISKSEAQKQAERLIGVTWDVGHINMMRKQGFDTKEISKQSEEIAKMVKHVHLSDNFGMEHTELPMGMGNTPIKEIMQRLGKEGYDSKKVVEAMHWWQHFKTPPFSETLGAMGSPIYAEGVGPYWNQTPGLYQDYYGGRGMLLPQVNYETMGVGFSQLPPELGGQRPGAAGSRMSGRPME